MYKEVLSALVFYVLVAVVATGPIEDVQIVESTIREVRALAPDDLLLAGQFINCLIKKNFNEIM